MALSSYLEPWVLVIITAIARIIKPSGACPAYTDKTSCRRVEIRGFLCISPIDGWDCGTTYVLLNLQFTGSLNINGHSHSMKPGVLHV